MGLFDSFQGAMSPFGSGQGGLMGMASPLGANPLTRALGISGEQGEYFQPTSPAMFDDAAVQEAKLRGQVNNSNHALDTYAGYGQGNLSLADALARGNEFQGAQRSAFQEGLATNPLSGSKLATDQVQNNAILGQLFGNGGALSQALAKERQLQNQGFQLTPEDKEAYGQVSGDVARLFGQSEQGAAQALARRGLASAPSGAAGAMFSGIQGNKNEQLAQAQMQIANQRMQNTMQRIGQQQQFASQLGMQGANAIQQQYGRNLGGVENAENQRNHLSDTLLNKYKTDVANVGSQNQANYLSMQDKREAKGKTLMEGMGAGLMNSSYQMGAGPGRANNAAIDSFASMGGKMMGGM